VLIYLQGGKAMNAEHDIKDVAKRTEDNARKIEENAYRISQNTGALEVLHTIKVNTILFFVMWIITFIMLLLAIGYIIYLENNTSTVITETETQQEVEQENENGGNYFIGGDGEIND
jgi:hypothetical protein